MQIPETLSRNTLAVYRAKKAPSEVRVLDGEDLEEWRKSIPHRLSEICLKTIVSHWEVNPLLDELTLDQDVRLLLDALPTTLPYELTVPKITDELFWRRCFCTRWPNKLPVPRPKTDLVECDRNTDDYSSSISKKSSRTSSAASSIGNEAEKTWKRCFLEMHLKECLEDLKPEDYNAEKIKLLVDLCRDYVKKLVVDQLLASTNASGSFGRIPLNSIVSGLPLLTELTICFKQTYAGENFKWHVLQTTSNDIKSLAAGLNKCNLTSFSIINSDVDCDKLILLARSLLNNKRLRMLDFSHCKIVNRGTFAIARLIRESPALEHVNLCNNLVGFEGVEALAYVISNFENRLAKLDLGLNAIGVVAGNLIGSALTKDKCILDCLKLAGCGLTADNLPLIEAVGLNTKLNALDLSSNRLGEKTGIHILGMVKRNKNLRKLDVRMCDILPSTVFAIENNLKFATTTEDVESVDNVICKLPKFDDSAILDKLEMVFPEICDKEESDVVEVEEVDENFEEGDPEISDG